MSQAHMCGIFFACSREKFVYANDATQEALRARGPDNLKTLTIAVQPGQPGASESSSSTTYLTFSSSVLSLRGDHVCEQPVTDPATGSCLCWNGEAWKIDDVAVTGNDTEQVFQLLLDASAQAATANRGARNVSAHVVDALMCVTGPYAFTFYDARSSIVYFGRDRLGRRSLVTPARETPLSDIQVASVSFGNSTIAEVDAEAISYIDLLKPTLEINSIPWRTPLPTINQTVPEDDQFPSATPSSTTVSELIEHLTESLRLRTLDVPTYTPNVNNSEIKDPSRVAILFSGGLDCTLLARLTHDILPADQPIDLLNVAFENPRTIRAAAAAAGQTTESSSPSSPYEACPDRITARSSFAELLTTCPSRVWRFVAIDVPYTDTLDHRDRVIRLMSPHNTEMDLSITLALYFASRGQGLATTSTSPASLPIPYTTTSRVLLSGLGADELFGGYTRHAVAFGRRGPTALLAELHLDITRIGTRNLGRDDRVLAHWGREPRYPYLDESFVAFALALPLAEKVGFRPAPKHFELHRPTAVEREEDLGPAKMLLRRAAWRLGVRGAAAEAKRAIHFGARTAKMVDGRTKGTDVLVV